VGREHVEKSTPIVANTWKCLLENRI